MNYLDFGYNNLLQKSNPLDLSDGITTENAEQVIASGAIDYNQTGMNTFYTNQNMQSKNYVQGLSGWKIYGNGTAEFRTLITGEFIRSFAQDDAPTSDLNTGDIWLDTNDNNKMYRYNGTSWIVVNDPSAEWAEITGTDKADDNATIGAIFGTNISGGGSDSNQISNSGYISQLDANIINVGTLTGFTIQTSTSGKRIKMYNDKIEIYNSSNVVVGTIEGSGQSGIFDLIGMNYVTAGDFTAIGSSLDSLIGIDSSCDLNLSTRKSGGGGGDIKIIAESGQDIIAYNNFIPNSDGSLYLGNSTYGWERVYLGSSSRYLYDNAGTLYFNGSAVGTGEANTASNKGGTSWYYDKSGVDLQFKGISVSSRLSLTSYTNYLYIDHAVGSGYNHIPSGGTTYHSLRNSSSGTASWSRAVYIGYSGWYFDYNSDGIVSSKNLMPATDGSQYLGNSTHGWGRVYIGTSGYYLYESGSKIFASQTVGVNKLNITYYANNPSSAGDITNYSFGTTQEFRGRPGSGAWAGSFDMTAY